MTRYQRKLAPLDPCPLEHVFTLIGGKWKARILHRLTLGDASIADFRRHLPRISDQVLKAQLMAMEKDCLIRRQPASQGELWGRFAITERGRSLHLALRELSRWGADDIGGWIAPTSATAATAA